MELTKQLSQLAYELRLEKVLHRETKAKLKSSEAALEEQVRHVLELEAALEARMETMVVPMTDLDDIHREEMEMLQDDVEMYQERCVQYEETIAKLREALEDNALGQPNEWILRQQNRLSYYLDDDCNDYSDPSDYEDEENDADEDDDDEEFEDEDEESEEEEDDDDEIFCWKTVDLRESCSEDTVSMDSDYELEQARLAQLCKIVSNSVEYEHEYLAVVDQIEAKLEEESVGYHQKEDTPYEPIAEEEVEDPTEFKKPSMLESPVFKPMSEPKDWLDDLLFEVAQLGYCKMKQRNRAGVVRVHDIDAISEYEAEFHHAFMKSRLGNEEFVYADVQNLLRELDEFCDVDGMHLPKGPLIVFGEPGSGKSAYLANWIHRRKKKLQNWNNGLPEFIFYHAVGCTRQGAFVSKLLERILTELKEYFELPKEVPTLEERLSWQFPRYLDAASRKGRIILIVDGVHRLRTNDGDSILKWLPLSFPANVRLVLAATSVPIAKDAAETNIPDLSTMERIKIEAMRRNWHTVYLLPLSEDEKRMIVTKYLQRQTQPGTSAGLQMFELQVKAVVSISKTRNPKFLRVLIMALAWAAHQGYNIHIVFKEWICAANTANLYECILRTMEAGYVPNSRDTNDAMHFLNEHLLDVMFFVAPQTSPTKHNSTTHTANEHHQSVAEGSILHSDCDSDEDDMSIPWNYEENYSDVKLVYKELSTGMNEDNEVATSDLNAPREILTSVLSAVSPQTSCSHDDCEESHTLPPQPETPNTPQNTDKKHTMQPVPSRHAVSYPIYVTGGREIVGLQNLLGKALCLLYVARHGLLLHELKSLVNAMILSEKEHIVGVPDEIEDPNDREFDSLLREVYPKVSKSKMAFQDSLWTSLLNSLKALGFIFLQDIVLFPLCYDALRDLVYWRYIGSPKAEQAYHNWLVRFFTCHPPSFRRVEELPWHLTFCKRWHALKEVLVNLPMFQLLFTANFKTELFSYWKTLSEGSVVNGSTTESCDVSDGTTKQAKQVITFDVVREYNKSLDDWYHAMRPSTKQLLPVIQSMTKFLFEYSVFSQLELPKFNHPIFDLKELTNNGFHFVNLLPHVLAQQTLEQNDHFYLYIRWVWIQFPWLALGYDIDEGNNIANIGASQTSISPELNEINGEENEEITNTAIGIKVFTINISPSATLTTTASATSLVTPNTLKRTSSMPTIPKPLNTSVAISPFKLKGFANASLPTIASSNAPSTLDIISPNSPMHLLLKRKTSFMGYKNAPTSSFTVQLENTILEETSLNSSLGKSLSQRSPMATNAMRDVDHISNQMVAEGFGLGAHAQDYAKTEYDVKKSCNQQVLMKLQQCHNFLKREANSKSNRLEKLRQTIRERKQKQNSSLQYINEATEALNEMTRRMDQVDASMKVVAKQEKTYTKLLKACETYPASERHHLARSKKELKLLQMTLKDLEKQHEALKFEYAHLNASEQPKLKVECEKNRRLHEAVLDRLEKTNERVVSDQMKIDELYQVRLGIIDNVKSNALNLKSPETIELEKKLNVQVTVETTVCTYFLHGLINFKASHKASIAKVALNQCQSMCRRIIAATGLSDMSAIHDKFNNREALNNSLDEQAQLYEARLKQIKMSQNELENQMKGLEHIHKECADPHVLEEDARDAESSLYRVQRTYSTQLHSLNELIIGLTNIARLAGITSVLDPKSGLVLAADLWPPYQDKDHRAVTLSQFESIPPEAMCDIIRACEERMMAIIDKNEHGRGDPDTLYGTKPTFGEIASKAPPTPRSSGSGQKKRKNDGLRLLKSVVGSKRMPEFEESSGIDGTDAMEETTPRPISQASQDLTSPRASVLERDDEKSVVTRENIKNACKHKLASKRKELANKSSASITNSHHEENLINF
ncbi:hypothetical protein THRCLA_03571 [Thraustotheca clavata]|uniref:ORC1/DEAH AAA+ ATPase domain-containing protein n=1 Tax=Thraustotheca clavata TaxID=74557 RepID=A0A1W0A1V3_9STRA|nr:hypothetical protein THRCLA_03571 [Thraustotheca clavata]